MYKRTLITTLTAALFSLSTLAQTEPAYIAPMDIPLILSGNFGEMRKNHFHTGIDIKTQGRQGVPLLSIADGHVSRIKVSPYGYGNALYIDHPDGRTSVYAHMREFSDSIAAYIHEKQYEQETWAIEYYPEAGELSLSQGDIIGLSGNSGSSAGPHLHFEIRETESEHPLNPLLMGFDIKDEISPVIKGMRAYPLDDFSQVEGAFEASGFVAKKGSGDAYRLSSPIYATGLLGLGIHSYDLMSGTNNKYGIYELEMYVNGRLHYAHTMDELDFDNFRQVNCHKDYDLYHASKWRYHKCFPAENNTLAIYHNLVDQGKLAVYEGDTIAVSFKARDIKGNESTLELSIIGAPSPDEPRPQPEGILMSAGQDNTYLDSGLVVLFPKGRIYEDFYLRPSRTKSSGLSDQFQLHDHDVPMDQKISIGIKSQDLAANPEHVVMLHTDLKGRTRHLKTEANGEWYESENRALGSYKLLQDSIAPQVSVTGFSAKSKPNKISLKLSDNQSGVVQFELRIDGQWLLMAHNASMSKAWGNLSELDLAVGDYQATIRVQDLAGNVKEESISFTYP